MGGSSTLRFREQEYKKLKKEALSSGALWQDPEFPADSASLFFDRTKEIYGGVEWRRPKEMVTDPHLFVDGVSVGDVKQGVLGNCWFVSACSVLTHQLPLLHKVIPEHEAQDDFCPKNYAGIFKFQFFRFGKWVEVCVDDRLPWQDGKLLFAHSKTPNEFWCALLEKAFAKLNGCYEALIAGSLSEALMNLSGGVPERIALANYGEPMDRRSLFFRVREAAEAKALIATAIAAKTPEEVEEVAANGLVKGHSYAVTKVREIEVTAKSPGLAELFSDGSTILMVRLQNPWGEKEWKGPWSDGSPEWDAVPKSQQKELGLVFNEDGEFWMSWGDFCDNFTDLSLCHMLNTAFWSWAKRWYQTEAQGAWTASPKGRGTPDDRAGGCLNFKASCLANPQFLVELLEDGAELVLSLVQKEPGQRRKAAAEPALTIGIHVIRVESNRAYRVHQVMGAVGTSEYTNARAEFLHLRDLKKGRYVILPTTYAPGEEGGFLLRLFSSEKTALMPLEKHVPSGGCCQCCKSKLAAVTRITLVSGLDIVGKSKTKDVDPYCILSCEGRKSQTPWVGQDTTPIWDHAAIFWRRKPQKPITIMVYDSNYLQDSFLGTAKVAVGVTNDEKKVEVTLEDKEGKKLGGRLVLKIATYDDPFFL